MNTFINKTMAATSTMLNNVLGNLEQYRNEDGEYNIPNSDSHTGKEILRDIVDASQRPKRPPSGYFLWLNDNRQKIKTEFFGDYESIQNWDLESKKTYYQEKGLEVKESFKEGKPKIVALVTSKAGIMWKELSSEDKKVYEDKSQILKDEYSTKIEKFNQSEKTTKKNIKKTSKAKGKAKNEKTETQENTSDSASDSASASDEAPKKKGRRGRPKKVKEEVNKVTENMVEEKEADNQVDVVEETINGKTYYLDESTGQIYDPESGDAVAEKNGDGTYTWM